MIFIDFALLTLLFLPAILNRTLIKDFLSVVHTSINSTQTNATQLYDDIAYLMQFNELKIYIEHFLNDKHDPVLRRIYINNIEKDQNTYLFNKSEQNENVYDFNLGDPDEDILYIYDNAEIDDLEDFVVVVPIGFVYNDDLMKVHVDMFRLPGMKYTIIEL